MVTATTTPSSQAAAIDHEGGNSKKSFKKVLGIAVLVIIAVVAFGYWLWARQFEDTDDAQVDGHFAQLSTRITGTVTYVNPAIENDRTVTAGTLLIELDPRDYAAALAHAKAVVEAKQAQVDAANLQVPITDAAAFSQLHLAQASKQEALASVSSAQAELTAAQHRVVMDKVVADRAERDRVRYEALVEKREISRSFYDARATEAAASAQTLAADQAAVAAAEQKVAQQQSLVTQRDAQIASARTAPQQTSDARARLAAAQGELDLAKADEQTAELNLSYTKIYAPVSGVVGHKTVELGHRIQPGQTLLTVVPVDDIWITANFKETQLREMKPGQHVTIHVDTFGNDYSGTVEDMAGASGPLFSLFPPENASGNYVKIVQRFPIRIHIEPGQDPGHNLRPGMSVEATVRVR
ncbi:MAG: HlyD family secretion protein [Acidobacteriaceae bacterium]|nr:HlyD family secretion protein [Acidobacteriaceae bacterium]